jgi:acyl-coenzyme A synthetase/AMP-(fatty) acid ligase
MIEHQRAAMAAHRSEVALVDADGAHTYADLLAQLDSWTRRLDAAGVRAGDAVTLEGDYRLAVTAALLAAIDRRCIVVPLSADAAVHHAEFRRVAGAQWRVTFDGGGGEPEITPAGARLDHPLYTQLRADGHPGLVLFSSGSTGRPKAALHDMTRLLAKYSLPRRSYRTLVFLLLDHIGGVNTLFYTLSNGGAIVTAPQRTPASICEAIARHRVELLPTSPTFLNLMLLSGEHRRHDLSSLRLVTYGTEPMPLSTLTRLGEELPGVKLQQTYGMTELGILRSQSRGDDSLWVKVGGEDFETKVVDNRLRVRARCAMLGYLNAPNPTDADGFFDTGDLVEVDGEWIRFLGRESEIVNVGGSKVYPAEVESVLLQMENVADAVVTGEPHALVGQIVAATVRLIEPEGLEVFKPRMRLFLGERLAAFKVPARVRLTTESLHSARFKRTRTAPPQTQPHGN